MIKVAELTAQGFMNGDISTVMSPRSVISWAQNALIFGDVGFAFRVRSSTSATRASAPLIAEYYQRVFGKDLPESVAARASLWARTRRISTDRDASLATERS
jgi:cobaltochelatase CobS